MAILNGLYVHVTDESASREVDATSHPVESGIPITDTVKPKALTISLSGKIVDYGGTKAQQVIDKIKSWQDSGSLITYRGRNNASNMQVRSFNTDHPNTNSGGADFSLELEQVRRFLASPLAERIRRAGEVYREYRFSLLLPASLYDPEAEPGDELMLQGVVDCAFRTEQGLVIVDFKTDRILPQEAAQRAELYRPQLTAYSQALSRVLEAPVAERVLYFFGPGCQVTL